MISAFAGSSGDRKDRAFCRHFCWPLSRLVGDFPFVEVRMVVFVLFNTIPSGLLSVSRSQCGRHRLPTCRPLLMLCVLSHPFRCRGGCCFAFVAVLGLLVLCSVC